MTTAVRVCVVVHWLALMLWISGLISAAVAAMNVFPTLDAIPLAADAYAAFPVAEHPRIVAGRIMEGVFTLVDLMQMVAAPVVLLTLVLQLTVLPLPRHRAANTIRTACVLLASGIIVYHVTQLAPPMNHALRGFWAAAEAGDVETARTERARFGALHPQADTLLRLNLLLLLGAAGGSALALMPDPKEPPQRLERPRLLDGERLP